MTDSLDAGDQDASRRERLDFERNLLSDFSLKLSAADSLEQLARVVSEVTDSLFQWEAFSFQVIISGKHRFRQVLTIDEVDGTRCDLTDPSDIRVLSGSLSCLIEGNAVIHHRGEGELSRLGNMEKATLSRMFVPVSGRNKTKAMFSIQRYEAGCYSENDLALAAALATQMRPALLRCLAEQESQVFSALGKRLSAATTPLRIAEIILDAGDRLLAWDSAAVNLYDASNHMAQSLIALDIVDGARQEFSCEAKAFPASQVQRETVSDGAKLFSIKDFLERYEDTDRFGDTERLSESLMFAPMRLGERAVGLVTFQSYTPYAFDESDLELLQNLADHASGALERTRIEEHFRKSQKRFRDLLDSNRDAIFEIDHNGKAVYSNPSAKRMFKIYDDPDSFTWFLKRVHFHDRPQFEALMVEIINGRELHDDIQTCRWRLDSGEIITEIRISSIRADEGKIGSYLISLRDVTEREMLEKRRQEMSAQIQQTQKLESIGVLAGAIAHDFNNLLTGILGNAELLAEDFASDTDTSESIADIVSSAKRAAELTQQMLIYAGKGEFTVQPINISKVIGQIRHLMSAQIKEPVQLALQIEPRIPYVEADVSQIQQSVMHLVSNSMEAMEGCTGIITVETGVRRFKEDDLTGFLFGDSAQAGEYVFVSVTDQGAGMGEETQKRIFEPFFTKRGTGLVGSRGLGLSAVAGIVRQHKGLIEVQSKLKVGTRVAIYIPVMTRVPNISHDTPVAKRRNNDNRQVLLIDDEMIVRRVARSTLEKNGYRVIEAPDSAKGMELLKAKHSELSLLLLDLTIRGKSTFEQLKQIRKDYPQLPVIVMCGVAERPDETAAQDSQYVRFFQKPFSPNTLLHCVSKMIQENGPKT